MEELAEELGMEGYSGTAEENINLHHAVLNTLAAEGDAMGAPPRAGEELAAHVVDGNDIGLRDEPGDAVEGDVIEVAPLPPEKSGKAEMVHLVDIAAGKGRGFEVAGEGG